MKVLSLPEWLVNHVNNMTNSKNTAKIEIVRDSNNVPYIDYSTLNDSEWNFNVMVTSPEGQKKYIKNWLVEIEYSPIITE
jgi:hypothetical protein